MSFAVLYEMNMYIHKQDEAAPLRRSHDKQHIYQTQVGPMCCFASQ